MEYFGLKLGQDLGNRAAHPYQEFRGVPPPPPGQAIYNGLTPTSLLWLSWLSDRASELIERSQVRLLLGD